MINESSPIIGKIIKKEIENNSNINNKSENISLKIKNNLSKEEENASIKIINPFDSIESKKIKLQSFQKNNNANMNNRYTQNSFINNSISNSSAFRQYNNLSYTLSTNKEVNTNKSKINDSNDINFDTINNSSINNNNTINENKKEEFNIIKESDDEEDEENKNKNYMGKIYLNDLESYVEKYYNNINTNDKKYYNEYEINKRISDIINKSPFENVNIILKKKTNEVEIEKLLDVNKIIYIKNLDNEQIIKKFNEDFYSQILSAKNFSYLNENLHNSLNFEVSSISVTRLYKYNGKNKNLIGKRTRDIAINDGNSFLKAIIFNYMENIIINLYINKLIFIIYIISTKLNLISVIDQQTINLFLEEIFYINKIWYMILKISKLDFIIKIMFILLENLILRLLENILLLKMMMI